MKSPRKTELAKLRVTREMKRQIALLAKARGESEAVIMREAISEYIKQHPVLPRFGSGYRRKHRKPAPPRRNPNGTHPGPVFKRSPAVVQHLDRS
jgi:hypothetical protein